LAGEERRGLCQVQSWNRWKRSLWLTFIMMVDMYTLPVMFLLPGQQRNLVSIPGTGKGVLFAKRLYWLWGLPSCLFIVYGDFFLQGWSDCTINLTTYLYLMPKLRMGRIFLPRIFACTATALLHFSRNVGV
jgi:hypothetical protein